jgi:hypothetical protein
MFNFLNDSISSGLSAVTGFDHNEATLPHWYVLFGSSYVLVVSE